MDNNETGSARNQYVKEWQMSLAQRNQTIQQSAIRKSTLTAKSTHGHNFLTAMMEDDVEEDEY